MRMMKRLIMVMPGILALNLVMAQNNPKQYGSGEYFTLKGFIQDAQVPYLYLMYTNAANVEVLDSSRITDSHFEFKGSISEPTLAILKAALKVIPDETNSNLVPFYLEQGNMITKVTYNQFQSMQVTGSKSQLEKIRLDSIMAPHIKHYAAQRKVLEALGQDKLSKNIKDSLDLETKKSIHQMRSATYQFILANPGSYHSANELKLLNNRWPDDSVRHLYNQFSPQIKNSRSGQLIAQSLASKDAAKIGSTANNFEGTDVNGQRLKLSDFKGKFILMDFWGSWCAPCREGNPHLIELYNRYKEKNFEVIGISCHDKDVPWRKAITKDGIGIWKNIRDTDEKKETIAHKYAVYSYPTKILLDPDGKIIGRYRGSESMELDKMLEQTLK